MTRLKIAGARLTASITDRTIRGILLPFGQEGKTNRGKVTASANTLQIPDPEDIILNVEHEAARPVGTAVQIEEEEDGIHAEFIFPPTAAADDALAEIEAGLREHLSVEVDDPVIRQGRLVAGRITGAALVAVPAFPGARLTAAADEGTLKNEDDEAEEEPTPTDEEDEEEMKITATAPRSTMPTQKTSKGVDKNRLFATLAGAASGDRRMLAALSDIVPSNILGIEQPQYVGELWDGKAYERQFIPCWNHADLSSFEITGWRWVTRPTVATYGGGKTDVPSAGVSTEQVKISAQRLAGAHDIDRKFRDFNNAEFWSAYYAAMTESYARVSDTAALSKVVEGATKVKAGDVPTGIAKGLVYIVDGILAVLKETDTIADTALVAPDLYRDILLTRSEDVLGYLDAALGFEDGTMRNFRIKPTAQIAQGKALISCKDAVTVHELGGGAPIRVEALDIARGGVDEGVFGYLAVNIHDKGGLALVNATGE